MSHPPGTPDPDAARDPWATPTGEPVPSPQRPDDPPPYPAPAYPPAPGYGQPAHQPGYGGWAPRPTNGKAQASMWSGIGLLVTSLCGLGVLGVVPIVLGVLARREITRSGGQQGGSGMALSGIITGAVAVVLSLIVIGAVIVAIATFDDGGSGYGTTGV